MASRRLAGIALAFALTTGAGASRAEPARIEWVYATQPGTAALDADRFGGNPFASGLVAALDSEEPDTARVLFDVTTQGSDYRQVPQVEALGSTAQLRPASGESAVALVVVFADYGDERGLSSLPGAAFDAARLGAAFTRAGYVVRTAVVRDESEYRAELQAFSASTAAADHAVLYTTGHGFEVGGTVFIVPPEAELRDDMLAASIRLPDLGAAMRAGISNRVFYAGCRDNPLGLSLPGGP